MIYLIDKIDLELFEINKNSFYTFDLFETTEERVLKWIENERCRSIFSRLEIINLFKTRYKVQVVKVDKIKLKKYDKLIVWTNSGRYFILEFKNLYK
jgi:hypothetical protein